MSMRLWTLQRPNGFRNGPAFTSNGPPAGKTGRQTILILADLSWCRFMGARCKGRSGQCAAPCALATKSECAESQPKPKDFDMKADLRSSIRADLLPEAQAIIEVVGDRGLKG